MIKRSNFLLILLYIYIILSPFYILKSGLPQLADFIMLIILVCYFISYPFRRDILSGMISLLVMNIILVNFIWMTIYSDHAFLLASSFYLFNFLIVLFLISFYRQIGLKLFRVIFHAVSTSLIIQFIISFIYQSPNSYREVLFFNNPNQLGYFALLSIVLIVLISTKINYNPVVIVFLNLISIYLSFISLSKASMLMTLFTFGAYIIIQLLQRNGIKYVMSLIVLVSTLSFVIYLNFDLLEQNEMIVKVSKRLSTIELDMDSNLKERRYDRISENRKYWIFGAGEGAFHKRFGVGEIHSTFFSFFFNYGLIGSSLLLFIILYLLKKGNFTDYVLLIPLFVYGLTHNGIRQSLLWIILTVIYIWSIEQGEVKDGK